jgi:hypothetical protein
MLTGMRKGFLKFSAFSAHPSVTRETGYGLVGPNSIPSTGKRFFSSSQNPNRFWGPHRLLFNQYVELFPGGKAAGA